MFNMERYLVHDQKLEPWVKFIWHFQADSINVHHKLLPMDSVDLLLNLSAEMIYETASRRIVAPRVHINSLRSEYSFIRQSGNVDIWGISFYSFGLFPFINKPLKDIQNSITDLHSLSVPLAEKLESAVSCGPIQHKIGCIKESLSSELHISNKYLEWTAIISDFLKTDESISIHSFCKDHGINERTFERCVLNYTGYTPYNLTRIRRFQAASNQLLFGKSNKLPEIAYDNNFTDQSHFVKEFRKFSGVPPRTFQHDKITVKENTNYIYI
ncbi:MAG TPA: helix-turn-helix domain-containing protein [Patescibacteria group bacterium]|nr:helix-turn-helix domain-containing protein [Patescibacteria group bacterium]